MRQRTLSVLLLSVCLAAGLAWLPSGQALAAEQSIYTDGLATSWSDYSWASVNLAATTPVHSGSASIRVDYGAWQGLYLAVPDLATNGFTRLRFWLHGGAAGGQKLNLYVYRTSDGTGQSGPSVAIPAPTANSWQEVRISLADLGAANTSIRGIVWQDATGGTQPTVYFDDIALIDDASPDGPVLSDDVVAPGAAPADGITTIVVRTRVSDPQGLGDIASVTLDATSLGRGTVGLRDDGRSNDAAAGDGLYGARLTIAPGMATGEQRLLLRATDHAGHAANLQLSAFVVLAQTGGRIPAALPQRLGWGTNEWSEDAASDWQKNSGVAWDYVYQYITYDWYVNGWGGDFVGRFARQAWNNGDVPVISAYLMLGTPPECGEGAVCYANKLKNASAVSQYLAAIASAARQAKGDKPVIFHLDPDFYGYMQQLSNDPANRPAGVKADDPNSYPVALNIAGYPNTLAGFGRRVVDVIHSTAPNALVAPHASMWATNQDPNNVSPAEAITMAQRTASFLRTMGGDTADLLFVEWSDRDSGSGLRPWWDDTNRALPRPSRAVLWENALSTAAGKRLILWQVPCGNMALNNTVNHYRDNRPAYAFNHPRDLVDAGVFAVLFGGGTGEMTKASTDGNFIRDQGAIAYAAPAVPTGLSVTSGGGTTASLRWDELSIPDIWGYRVSYRPASGGASTTIDVRRANATTLVLPTAGDWRVSVAAYDAMGRVGVASSEVSVTTTADAAQVYLPVVRR